MYHIPDSNGPSLEEQKQVYSLNSKTPSWWPADSTLHAPSSTPRLQARHVPTRYHEIWMPPIKRYTPPTESGVGQKLKGILNRQHSLPLAAHFGRTSLRHLTQRSSRPPHPPRKLEGAQLHPQIHWRLRPPPLQPCERPSSPAWWPRPFSVPRPSAGADWLQSSFPSSWTPRLRWGASCAQGNPGRFPFRWSADSPWWPASEAAPSLAATAGC